jgi:hypothetical protein
MREEIKKELKNIIPALTEEESNNILLVFKNYLSFDCSEAIFPEDFVTEDLDLDSDLFQYVKSAAKNLNMSINEYISRVLQASLDSVKLEEVDSE